MLLTSRLVYCVNYVDILLILPFFSLTIYYPLITPSAHPQSSIHLHPLHTVLPNHPYHTAHTAPLISPPYLTISTEFIYVRKRSDVNSCTTPPPPALLPSDPLLLSLSLEAPFHPDYILFLIYPQHHFQPHPLS